MSVIPGNTGQTNPCTYDQVISASISAFADRLVAPGLGHIVSATEAFRMVKWRSKEARELKTD
jgi:hypothetical protein